MSAWNPILVTGAAGNVGSVGRKIVEILRARDFPVRAMVHREDDRAMALRALGAEVVVGDLNRALDVVRVMKGCRRVYFGMSLSPTYLEATTTAAAAAREQGDIEVFVNISQMTVSQMSLTEMTESRQQQQHWLGEQVLNWSGLPVVHLRATVFLQHFFFLDWAAESIRRDGTIRLPFGKAKTSPIDTSDVAEVAAAILAEPASHVGGPNANKVYELTGPHSENMQTMAAEYSAALWRPVTYVDVPFAEWEKELLRRDLPDYVLQHIDTMAKLHAANRYDRQTDDVERITGKPATSVQDFVRQHATTFTPVPAKALPTKSALSGAN